MSMLRAHSPFMHSFFSARGLPGKARPFNRAHQPLPADEDPSTTTAPGQQSFRQQPSLRVRAPSPAVAEAAAGQTSSSRQVGWPWRAWCVRGLAVAARATWQSARAERLPECDRPLPCPQSPEPPSHSSSEQQLDAGIQRLALRDNGPGAAARPAAGTHRSSGPSSSSQAPAAAAAAAADAVSQSRASSQIRVKKFLKLLDEPLVRHARTAGTRREGHTTAPWGLA
jgi:hypothetical protein